jgi:hypothetical protein
MNPLPNNMKHYKLYALKPVSGGRSNRISLYEWGEAASVRNACDLCHAILHVQSGLGVQIFKCWWLYKYSPASASFFTQPVSKLIPSWTPSPYLRPKCHPSQVLPRCIGALPAWAAQPAAASRLFSMTTNRPRLTTRAASTATSPRAGSRQSPFSWTPAPSTLAMAWPEPVERLASGAPNPPHPAAPQVPWYRMWYH